MLEVKNIDRIHSNGMEYISDMPYTVNYRIEREIKSNKKPIPFLESIESIIHRIKPSFWLPHSKNHNRDISSRRSKRSDKSLSSKNSDNESSNRDFNDKSSNDILDIQEPLNIMEHILTPNTLRNIKIQESLTLEKIMPFENNQKYNERNSCIPYTIKTIEKPKESIAINDKKNNYISETSNDKTIEKYALKQKSFARIDQRILKKLDLNKVDQMNRHTSLIKVDKPYKIDKKPSNRYSNDYNVVYTKQFNYCHNYNYTHDIQNMQYPTFLSNSNMIPYYHQYIPIYALYPQLYYPVMDN